MMETSSIFQSSQPSAISPDGVHVATLRDDTLEIRRISSLDLLRSVHVPLSSQSRFLSIRWSPRSKVSGTSDRFLVSDEDHIRVWDMQDHQWTATIDNGSGSMGRNAHVEFGNDETEVMAFSQFGARITVWELWTGKGIELKDPKFTRGGHGRSAARTPIFALLSRQGAQDVISLHLPGTYGLIKSFSPQTVDAQGLKWSPDGRWLAVWDALSTGYKVLIYTADGNLFRTHCGDYFTDELNGLGVKNVEWSPSGDFLVVAGFQKKLTLLGTKTFSPAVELYHSNTLKPAKTDIWQEAFMPLGRPTYSLASQPITPPAATPSADEPLPKIGASIVAFSIDGSYLATKEDSMPTAVWIWDLSQTRCCAVLLQHSVVKKLLWHPTDPNTLMIQCIQGESILYSWNGLGGNPRVLDIPAANFSGKTEAQWVPKQAHRKPIIMFGDMRGFVLAYPDGKGTSSSTSSEDIEERNQAEADSDDSLFEILSGRKAGPRDGAAAPPGTEDLYTADGFLEDTFRYRNTVHV